MDKIKRNIFSKNYRCKTDINILHSYCYTLIYVVCSTGNKFMQRKYLHESSIAYSMPILNVLECCEVYKKNGNI
jgi:hypothetical protein